MGRTSPDCRSKDVGNEHRRLSTKGQRLVGISHGTRNATSRPTGCKYRIDICETVYTASLAIVLHYLSFDTGRHKRL